MVDFPLISICVPAYKADKVIGDLLYSIGQQTFDDFEVILIDDGSPCPLCIDTNKYDSSLLNRIRLFREENAGTYVARQTAISKSIGRYVFCVDADDALIDSNVLCQISDALNRFSYPDVLLFNAARDDGSICVSFKGMECNGRVPRDEIIHRFFVEPGWNSMWSMVFRRDLFVENASHPFLLMGEDRLQKAEVFARASSFALLDMPLYHYKNVAGSKMNSPFVISDFQNRVFVECRIREFLDQLGATDELWAYSFCGYLLDSLNEFTRFSERKWIDRIKSYPLFRDCDGCNEALSFKFRCLPLRDAICLDAFASRRWVMLDALLQTRAIFSVMKKRFGK